MTEICIGKEREKDMQTRKHGIGRPLAVSAALLGCVWIVLFAKWLGLRLLYQQWDASLWKVGKLFSSIADTAANYGVDDLAGSVTGVYILLYALLAATLFSIFISTKSVISSFRQGGDISAAGFWGTIVLSVIILLTVSIINTVVKEQTDGWLEDILALTYAPFLSIFFAVAGIICSRCIPADALSSVSVPDFKLDLQAVANTLSTASRKANDYLQAVKTSAHMAAAQADTDFCCLHCGTQITDAGYQFCPCCGEKLLKSRFCEECGKELKPDMKFCPYCGTRVKLDVHS